MRYLNLLVLTVLAACGAPSLEAHQLKVTIEDERLTIRGVGERLLLDLPIRELAARSGSASHQMKFGSFLVEDLPQQAWQVSESIDVSSDDETLTAKLDGLGTLTAEIVADGHAKVTWAAEQGNRARMVIDCAADERFMGFGAQTHDVDHRGQRIPLWVSEQGIGKNDTDEVPPVWFLVGRRHSTHIPVAATVTSRGIAWAVETDAYTEVDLCLERADATAIELHEATVRLHVFDGPSPMEALKRFTGWVGRPKLPPAWVFAPWNDAVFGEENVQRFAEFLRDDSIPTSAIWSEDWKGGNWHGDAYRLEEDWRLDREIYPEFETLTQTLRTMGIHLMVYFNTFVFEAAEIFNEAHDQGFLVKDKSGEFVRFQGPNANFTHAGLIDLTNEAAVEWVANELRQALDYGARGWMADYAEWMPVDDVVLASGEDPALVHNRYPIMWQQLNERVIEEAGLADEAIAFYRSGWMGSQPYARVIWAGDQNTDFDPNDGFPTILPLGIGLSATGFPFYGHDIAGYQSNTTDPSTKELFLRWTSLGAFSPVMRTHHGTHASENWNLERDEETTAHWKRYARLHMQLFPYLWGLAQRAVNEGEPIWRGLGLEHPAELELWSIMDQVYLGPALMVAPVQTQGATARQVVIPSGRFAPFFGGEAVTGPKTVEVQAPVTEIPVFVRAGGLVPMLAEPVDTLMPDVEGLRDLGDTNGDRLLHVGLGAAGRFCEADGACYELTGEGTAQPANELVLQGNTAHQGDGWRLVTTGQPSGRQTRVIAH
ncbi:MAG: TIM-barrel domain-containing protein [Myxococcota bacterium]|nr:TIM-barrel domain-containing protein [Myxococcota bacterium]